MSDTSAEAPLKPGNPNVARAGVIMMVSLLLSRVLGLVRDAVISGKFGSDQFTDAYRLAFQVPDLLFFLIAGGALSSAFIPVFSEYLHTNREREAWHVFSVVTTVMSLLVAGFIVIAWIYAEPLARVVAPFKPADQIPLIAQMSRIILPAQFAFFIGGLMFGTLYARQVFAVPGLGPNIYNLGIIFGALVLSTFYAGGLGVMGMSWGALIGAMVGNLVIPFFAMRRIGLQFKPSFDVRHPGVRKVFVLMAPVVLGLSLPGVYALIMQALATAYEAGVNTYLEFSNKLMQAPLGIFGQSFAIGVFPALAQFFAQKRMDMYRNQLASTLRTVLFLTIPTSVFMFVMAPQIVDAVLKHGEFTAEDARNTAAALRWFCIGIAAWCMHPVLMRGFFAAQVTVTPIVLGTLTTAVFAFLAVLLYGSPLGFLTLPLAGSISAIFLIVVLLWAIRRTLGGLDLRGILVTAAKSVLASVPVAAVGAAVALTPVAAWIAPSKLLTILMLGAAFLVASWGYFLAARALGMPETRYVSRALDRLSRRGKPKAADDPTA